jgi:sugar O-acyltransferase (sialic acid O-acetyltransferase NeuD family)
VNYSNPPKIVKNVVVIGASGHGSVVLDCIEQEGKYNVIGFLDSFKKKGRKQNGYQILGNEYDLPYLTERFNLHGGIVAIGDNWTRSIVVQKIQNIVPDFSFITTIHPTAVIGKDVTIGKGAVIVPGVIVNANSIVADHCILNTNSSLGHDGYMSDFTSLASGVCTGGNFTLGNFSAISLGTKIIENITVGEHTVVGAGSLVIKDLKNNVIAYGSPAKVTRARAVGEQYLSGISKSALFRFG